MRHLTRDIFRQFADLEPYVELIDAEYALPLRLVHDQAAGLHLELGPYSLNRADVNLLREAIAAYDRATPWLDLP